MRISRSAEKEPFLLALELSRAVHREVDIIDLRSAKGLVFYEAMMTPDTTYIPLVRALRQAFGDKLRAAVLFGSRARGEATDDSDHDVFLVIEDLPQEPVKRLKTVRMPLLSVDLNVSTVAKTPAELEADPTPLILDICTDGVCLHGADYFEPLRARALRAIKQSGLIRERIGDGFFWHFPDYRHRNWELTWDGYREVA